MGRMAQWFKQLRSSGTRAIKSRDLLLYLGFVFISAVFWCFITFNKVVQQDVTVNLVLTGKPANVTFIDEPPATITVTVRDKGTAFIKLMLRSTPTVTVDFHRYASEDDGVMHISSAQLNNEVKQVFRHDATIVKTIPDAIHAPFTSQPGKKVPVNFFDAISVMPDEQHVIYGDISITPDSVFIYGDEAVTRSIKEVNISPVNVTGLAEPLERNIMLRPIKDVRIEPRRVKLSVPVEPLIRKELSVPVVVRNAPTSLSVIVFPSSLKVSFLLPQSLYKKTHNDIVAIVDYNDIEQNPQAHKVHIATVEAPVIYSNIKLSSDSVEFIIDY